MTLPSRKVTIMVILFSCSWFWNSVIIIDVPLAPWTGEVASVGMVAYLANSSCVPCHHTRLWETTFQALVSAYLPHVHRLDWKPILCCSMDDHYYWWASLIMELWMVLKACFCEGHREQKFYNYGSIISFLADKLFRCSQVYKFLT